MVRRSLGGLVPDKRSSAGARSEVQPVGRRGRKFFGRIRSLRRGQKSFGGAGAQPLRVTTAGNDGASGTRYESVAKVLGRAAAVGVVSARRGRGARGRQPSQGRPLGRWVVQFPFRPHCVQASPGTSWAVHIGSRGIPGVVVPRWEGALAAIHVWAHDVSRRYVRLPECRRTCVQYPSRCWRPLLSGRG